MLDAVGRKSGTTAEPINVAPCWLLTWLHYAGRRRSDQVIVGLYELDRRPAGRS